LSLCRTVDATFPFPVPSMKHSYLTLAHRAGLEIASKAMWSGDACTWMITVPDRGTGVREAVQTVAGTALYQGAAGIGLFLAELAAVTNDPEMLRPAHGAAVHCYETANSLPPDVLGLYGGRVGALYFLARFAFLHRVERYREWANTLLGMIAHHERDDRHLDVIGGGAGAAGALLRVAHWLDLPTAADSALRMADHLVMKAMKSPDGWWWDFGGVQRHRALTGFAHGASGYAYGLLEAYAFSGNPDHRYAAEQGFAYERSVFDRDVRNWPDFRRLELQEMVATPESTEELRQLIRSGGSFTPYTNHFMSAWCHGAPGIALARLRAVEILGDPLYAAEANFVLPTIVASTVDEIPRNHSLCHGLMGNCETLFEAACVLKEDAWRAKAFDAVNAEIERLERTGGTWKSGVIHNAPDPSLLVGLAGTGHSLLRMAHPGVPSVLLVRGTELPGPVISAVPATSVAVRNSTLDDFFRRTIGVFDRLCPDAPTLRATADGYSDPVIARVYEVAKARIEREGDVNRRALMTDAFLLDRVAYEMAEADDDFTAELRDSLLYQSPDELDWEDSEFMLHPRIRMVTCRYDWDAWLSSGASEPPRVETPTSYITYCDNHRVRCRRIGAFARMVCEALATPFTVDAAAAHLSEHVNVETQAAYTALRNQVQAQIRNMHSGGLVVANAVPLTRVP